LLTWHTKSGTRSSLDGSCWLAAWENNQMLGFAHGMANDTPGVWKLDKLYVHPRHQRKGVGKALLEGVIEHAARAKAGKLVLRVNRDNSAALAAYAQYGFRVYGEDMLNIGHGFVMDDYLMELDVS
jgi:ribosomal protein S18 acetylase RimI-like enzyme